MLSPFWNELRFQSKKRCYKTERQRFTKEARRKNCICVWEQRGQASMTALQELSIRLSLFSRSLPLSTLREASGHLYRRHRSPHVWVSYSSPCCSSLPVADLYFPVLLVTGASHRHLSTGRDDLKLGALERSERGPSITDDLRFGDLKISDDDDVDSSSGSLVSDGSEEAEDTESRSDDAQFSASGYVKYVEDGPAKEPSASNYLTMSDKQLFAKCRMDTYRASGPGGQHRNKTDSAVRLTHIPTGLVAQAAEDRSQHINRSLALTRLRQTIALEVRDSVKLDGYKPPLEFVRILPSGTGGKRGNSQRIGPKHPDFTLVILSTLLLVMQIRDITQLLTTCQFMEIKKSPVHVLTVARSRTFGSFHDFFNGSQDPIEIAVQGMKALMDLLHATNGSVSDAAKALGLTTGALSKLITSNNLLWQGVNKLRAQKSGGTIITSECMGMGGSF